MTADRRPGRRIGEFGRLIAWWRRGRLIVAESSGRQHSQESSDRIRLPEKWPKSGQPCVGSRAGRQSLDRRVKRPG